MRWRISEPTLRSDPAASPRVYATATAHSGSELTQRNHHRARGRTGCSVVEGRLTDHAYAPSAVFLVDARHHHRPAGRMPALEVGLASVGPDDDVPVHPVRVRGQDFDVATP